MATLNEPAQERIADLHGIVKQLERAASVAAPRSSNVTSRPSPSTKSRPGSARLSPSSRPQDRQASRDVLRNRARRSRRIWSGSRSSSSPSHGGRSAPAANCPVRQTRSAAQACETEQSRPRLDTEAPCCAPEFLRPSVHSPAKLMQPQHRCHLFRLKDLLSLHRSRQCRDRPIPIAIHASSHNRGGQFLNSADN